MTTTLPNGRAAVQAIIDRVTAGMSQQDRDLVIQKAADQRRRARFVADLPAPLEMACHLDQSLRRTPALELLSCRLSQTVAQPDGRLLVSVPPREGKTTSVKALCTWLLISNPEMRIVYASYADRLARDTGRVVRANIALLAPQTGLRLSRERADAADWRLEGHRGGMMAVGVGVGLTGFGADLLIIDDVHKDRAEADSQLVRDRVWSWWTDVARTRLHKGAPVIVVGTRWHPEDLIGRLAGEGWPAVNIPALADGGTVDDLARPVGEWMVSGQGRTPEDWAAIRADVGERAWAALYQGRPAPLEGGAFKRDWFDTWRVDEPPAGCLPPTVVVDPADNEGDGDEAGIILATYHPATARVFILDDLSAPMSVGRWARVAMLTCVRRDAPTLAYEQSLARLPARMREAWATLHQQATAVHRAEGDRAAALRRLSRADDTAEAADVIRGQLNELSDDDVAGILAVGQSGPRLKKIQARGTKQARMQWVAPQFETGRAVIVGRLPQLEFELVTWQPGQDSPDRADAACHAASMLAAGAGVATLERAGASAPRVPTSSAGMRNAAGRVPTRSVRRR